MIVRTIVHRCLFQALYGHMNVHKCRKRKVYGQLSDRQAFLVNPFVEPECPLSEPPQLAIPQLSVKNLCSLVFITCQS